MATGYRQRLLRRIPRGTDAMLDVTSGTAPPPPPYEGRKQPPYANPYRPYRPPYVPLPAGRRRLINIRIRRRRRDPDPRPPIIHGNTPKTTRLATNNNGPGPPPTDGPHGPAAPPLAYPKREAPGIPLNQGAREVTDADVNDPYINTLPLFPMFYSYA